MNETSFKEISFKALPYFMKETAHIDDSDIVEDFLTDGIFQSNVYASEGHEHLGFIAGYPTFVSVKESFVSISLVNRMTFNDDDKRAWRAELMENLVGIRETKCDYFCYMNMGNGVIYHIRSVPYCVTLRIFHSNVE